MSEPRPTPATPSAAPTRQQVLAQTGMELRLLLRNGESLLVSFGIPLGILVFASVVVPVSLGDGEPLDTLVPAILALSVMSTAFTAQAIQTGFQRKYAVLKRLGATPLSRTSYLVSKALAVSAIVVLQSIAVIAVGPAARLVVARRRPPAAARRRPRARHGRVHRARPAAGRGAEGRAHPRAGQRDLPRARRHRRSGPAHRRQHRHDRRPGHPLRGAGPAVRRGPATAHGRRSRCGAMALAGSRGRRRVSSCSAGSWSAPWPPSASSAGSRDRASSQGRWS